MALPILDGNQSATTLSTILSGGEHTPAHTVVSLGSTAISNITSAVSGSVVSVSNLPSTQTIAGTVTANAGNFGFDENQDLTLGGQKGILVGWYDDITGLYRRAGDAYPLPVGGNLDHSSGSYAGKVVPVQIIRTDDEVAGKEGAPFIVAFDSNSGSTTVTVSSLPTISGTVTVGALPSGALTTRFGSVTTANTAQISSAVTNATRKYLLIQNVTTSSNAITIGIGFTPTTTQGIQLTAGAGITFESSYIPTGAVYVLSSVTASNFTILEA